MAAATPTTISISRELACHLVASAPRPLTVEVAELSLQLDLDAGGAGVTCAGYSTLWGWSQGRVGRYMESRGWRIEGGGRGRGKKGKLMLISGQSAPQPKEQPGEGAASPPPSDEKKEIEDYISFAVLGPKVRDPAALAADLRRRVEKEGGLSDARRQQLAKWRAASAPLAAPPAASWEKEEAARLKKKDEEDAARREKMDDDDYKKYEAMNELDRARIERVAGAEVAPGSMRWKAEIARAVRKSRPLENVGGLLNTVLQQVGEAGG